MVFMNPKSQGQKVSGTTVPDTTEFGKDRFSLEQHLQRNLNNALDINGESSYSNSFIIKVASNDSGFFFLPVLPVSFALDSTLYFRIFAIASGVIYPFKTLLSQNNAYFVEYDKTNPNLARAFFFPWLDGIPTRLKINNLDEFIRNNVTIECIPIMQNVHINPTSEIHIAISGSSGSGKDFLAKYLLKCLHFLKCKLVIIDPKVADLYLLGKELGVEVHAPSFGDNFNGFLTTTNEVLSKILNLVYRRQEVLLETPNKTFTPIYVCINELLSLNQLASKQAREAFAQLLSSISLLGRATSVKLILISQRFDATSLGGLTATREQISCTFLLGEINNNTTQYLFPNQNLDNIVVPIGLGTGIIKFTGENNAKYTMPLLTPSYN